jgi:hypothetical protein
VSSRRFTSPHPADTRSPPAPPRSPPAVLGQSADGGAGIRDRQRARRGDPDRARGGAGVADRAAGGAGRGVRRARALLVRERGAVTLHGSRSAWVRRSGPFRRRERRTAAATRRMQRFRLALRFGNRLLDPLDTHSTASYPGIARKLPDVDDGRPGLGCGTDCHSRGERRMEEGPAFASATAAVPSRSAPAYPTPLSVYRWSVRPAMVHQ